MIIDATFWVAVSFFIFLGVLIYFRIPQKITSALNNSINLIKTEVDDAELLKEESKNILSEYEKKIENEIDIEIKSAEKEIKNLKKDSLKSISTISEEMASKVIEQISGEPMNQSSVQAAILEATKNNLSKYL